MATMGMSGDVNNSIFLDQGYPVGRTFGIVPAGGTDFTMRNNFAGELGGLNQDFQSFDTTNAAMAGVQRRNGNGNGTGKRPARWWLTFAIIFVVIAWAARRFAPDGESFAIIKPNLINGVFLTLWIVLILVFLKQVALRVKGFPGLRALSDMILSA